jgi:ABC-type antimicrobial peptide transport system permease subunit
MVDFQLYFSLGLEHILSPDALDHQLFLLALVAGYTLKDWKTWLVLITAFTLGHSLTLALSSSGQIRLSSYWIELIIPFTIFLAGLFGFVFPWNKASKKKRLYPLSGLFGLVHGLGFANTLKAMLGKEQSLIMPLFGFNIGLELGQLLVIVLFLSLLSMVEFWFKKPILITRICSLLAIFGASYMIWERF